MKKYVIKNNKYGNVFKNFPIKLQGFKSLPKGFKNNGEGFTNGKPILELLKARFGKFSLTIAAKRKSSIKKKGNAAAKVVLNLGDIQKLSGHFFANRKAFNHKIVLAYFNQLFPKYYTDDIILVPYEKGLFSSILKNLNPSQISPADRQALIDYFPKISSKGINLKSLLKQKGDYQLAYLEKSMNELSERIKKSTKLEKPWQDYIKNNIVFLHDTYIEKIEHLNVSIDVRLPDFCLLNYENYLDVLEIKTPKTELLLSDESHKNYYWSAEMSKAISQVENYLEAINKHADRISTILRDKNLEVRVIKPRGLILAGSAALLKTKKSRDNFRLLSEGLKNIQILTYDDLTQRVQNIIFSIRRFSKKKAK